MENWLRSQPLGATGFQLLNAHDMYHGANTIVFSHPKNFHIGAWLGPKSMDITAVDIAGTTLYTSGLQYRAAHRKPPKNSDSPRSASIIIDPSRTFIDLRFSIDIQPILIVLHNDPTAIITDRTSAKLFQSIFDPRLINATTASRPTSKHL